MQHILLVQQGGREGISEPKCISKSHVRTASLLVRYVWGRSKKRQNIWRRNITIKAKADNKLLSHRISKHSSAFETHTQMSFSTSRYGSFLNAITLLNIQVIV